MTRIDDWFSRLTRALARRTSRRSLLGALGAALLGGAAVPLLPVARSAAREPAPGEPDPNTPIGDAGDCAYWRYCAIDGFLASCCGGTHTTCPPGAQMAPVTWLGTCRNPVDGVEYVISYNDCCAKGPCGKCFCRRDEGDKPVYYTPRSNDIDWCMGTSSVVYNSTVAVVVGIATQKE